MIRAVTEEDWERLKSLWVALYDHQRAHGMRIELPDNAYDLWADSLKAALDRFTFVFVADEDKWLVGFLAGRIRTHPPYLGGRKVGFISEVFPDPAFRNRGIAEGLLRLAQSW